MKSTIQTLPLIIAGLTLSCLPVTSLAQHKHDHGDHGHDHGDHGHGDAHAPKVPQSVPGAWTTLQEHLGKVKKAVEAGDHQTIHHSEPVIQACLKVLGEKSNMIEEKNQARLQGALKQAAKAGDTLHHAADDGNADTMKKSLKQLEGILKLIEAQYPEGVIEIKE